MIRFQRAREGDIETVVELHAEARSWLTSKGTDQWQPEAAGRTTTDAVRNNIRKSVLAGTCWIAYIDGLVVGTVTIDSFADPEFWTKDDNPGDAVYVHRMIVRRESAGRSIGQVMLLFADTIAREAGRHWVRLDAWSTNSNLHTYYRRMGFEHVRTLRFQHRGSGALFQRPVPEQPVISDPPWVANHLANPATSL